MNERRTRAWTPSAGPGSDHCRPAWLRRPPLPPTRPRLLTGLLLGRFLASRRLASRRLLLRGALARRCRPGLLLAGLGGTAVVVTKDSIPVFPELWGCSLQYGEASIRRRFRARRCPALAVCNESLPVPGQLV